MLLLPADVGFDWLDLFRGSNRVKICFVILFFCFLRYIDVADLQRVVVGVLAMVSIA